MRPTKIHFTSASDFVSATAKKIRSFGALPIGWHYGQGRPLSVDVINKALAIDGYYRQLGFTTTDAFPGADGELMITAYRGPNCIETIISTDLHYSVTHERDNTEISAAQGVSEIISKRTIKQIGAEIWRSLGLLGLSTESTTTKRGRGLQGSRSRTQKVAGFLSFSESVWMPQRNPFANTSGTITLNESLANPQFTGSSRNQYFLPEAA